MPRINIEERWWSDDRRLALILDEGVCQFIVDGFWFNIIRLAQRHFTNGEIGIPSEKIEAASSKAKQSQANGLLHLLYEKVGLIKKTECGNYWEIKGKNDCFDWILSKQDAGKIGGKNSGLKRSKPKQGQASNPHTHTHTHSQSHTHSQVHLEKELRIQSEQFDQAKKLPKKSSGSGDPEPVTKIRNSFLESYKIEFGHEYPGWGAKENSQAKSWLRSVPIAKAIDLCKIYPKWNDPWITKQGHPFGPLTTQYVQLEAWAKNHKQRIQKIAAGKAMENIDIKRAIEREESKNGLREFIEQSGNDSSLSGQNQKQLSSNTARQIPGGPFGLPEGPF